MRRSASIDIAIVGAGRVGQVLGRLLQEGGARIVCVVSGSPASAQSAGRFLRCRNTSTSLFSIPEKTEAILVATPHAAVGPVAEALSRVGHLRFKSLAACHTSGMLTAGVLEPLRVRGAAVFSFHPLQTFPRDFAPRDIVNSARGIFYGVDGMPRALVKARQLARILGGKVIEIPPEMRAFYHASCVLASNHLTTMLSILENMFGVLRTGKKGFFDVYRPILLATLKNIEATSPARSLSGPIARGGVETVAEHFSAISRFAPDLVPYFAHLSLETVRLAQSKGSINDAQAQAMSELARRYMTAIHHSPETN